MKRTWINAYLHDIERELRWNGSFDPDTLAEIESHLLESLERGLRQGLSDEEAERQAIKRFGSIHMVAAAFEREGISPMQKILFSLATLSGLFFVYVDTRPLWDDTGILAAAILLTCGLIALIGFKRPWLLALAVGIWIPLYGILVSHNPASILALVIALAGAHAGWAIRLGVRKVLHPA